MKKLTALFVFAFCSLIICAQVSKPSDNNKDKTQKNPDSNASVINKDQEAQEDQNIKSQEDKKENQEKQDIKYTEDASGVRRSIHYKFSTLSVDGDPGTGIFRYNCDTVSKITWIFVDNNDLSGDDQTNWYSTWDKTTGATARGSISVVEYDGKNVMDFDFTGVFLDGKGYWKFPVMFISGQMPSDGAIYYYIFNRIDHKKLKPDQETQVIPEPKPVQEPQVVDEPKPVQEPQVVEEPKPVQEPQVTPELKPVQEPQVVEEPKPIQEPQVIPELKPVQEPQVVEEPKPIQEPQVTPELKPVQEPQVVEEAKPIPKPQVVEEPKPVQEPQIVEKPKPAQEAQVVKEPKPMQEPQVAENPKPVQEKPVVQEPKPIKEPQVAEKPKPVKEPQAVQETKPIQEPQPAQKTQTVQTTQTRQTIQTTQPKEPAPVKQTTQTTHRVQTSQQIPASQSNTVSQVSKPVVVENIYATTSVKHRKCYRGIIEAGYALGIGDYGINNFRFNFINGIRVGQYSSIGLGIGYRRYFTGNQTAPYLVSSEKQIPVFIDLRTTFSSKKLTPYLAVDIGNSSGFGSSGTKPEGLLFSTSGGIWYNVSDRFAVFAGIAWEMQKLEFSDDIPYTNNYKKNANSVSLNIGISF
jgi:hypothetical protein